MRALEGYDILVIDADRQTSATLWSNIRVTDQILSAVAGTGKTGEALGTAPKDLATR
jgi:cellulose biosynthesis protein BcsQ